MITPRPTNLIIIFTPRLERRRSDTALSTFTSIYRQRWGCEFALQGARLRIARQHLVAGAAPCDEATTAPSAGFHPGDRAAFARAAAHAELGCPAHRRGAGGSF